jgi:hypothetical protein
MYITEDDLTSHGLQETDVFVRLVLVLVEQRRKPDACYAKLEDSSGLPEDHKCGAHLASIIDHKLTWIFYLCQLSYFRYSMSLTLLLRGVLGCFCDLAKDG